MYKYQFRNTEILWQAMKAYWTSLEAFCDPVKHH